MRRRMGRGLAALSVLAMLAAACGSDDDDTTTATTEADGGGGDEGGDEGGDAVEITAVDYAFEGVPEELTAGTVELSFANEGKVDHELALVEVGDTSLEQFLKDFPPVLEGGPFPDYAEGVAVPIDRPAGESGDVTFILSEGTYAMFCTFTGDASAAAPAEGEEPAEGEPHYALGMAQLVTVAAGEAGELPEADGTITAKDYSFEPDVEAGDTTINFLNEGPDQVHFAQVSVFPEGTDVAAAEAAWGALMGADEANPPPEGTPEPEDVSFSGIYSSGLGAQFMMPGGFESGRTYVLACFISDRAGGPPHAIGQKMYKIFTVE